MALLPRWPVIQLVSDVVKGVEALGATIMVNAGLRALDDYALSMVWLRSVQESYPRLCRRSGQAVLLRLDATLTAPSPARLSSVRPWKAWPALRRMVVIRSCSAFQFKPRSTGPGPIWPRTSGAARTVGVDLG